MNKQKIIIAGLAVALSVAGFYILSEKIITSRQEEIFNAYQNGYNKGLTDAVSTLFKQTANCHPTTIYLGNLTKDVFDLACIQKTANQTR